MLSGMPSLAAVDSMASTPSPSEAPGARLNDTVVAGNCPRWLITSGPVVFEKRVTALRGTCTCGVAMVEFAVAAVVATPVPVPAMVVAPFELTVAVVVIPVAVGVTGM